MNWPLLFSKFSDKSTAYYESLKIEVRILVEKNKLKSRIE